MLDLVVALFAQQQPVFWNQALFLNNYIKIVLENVPQVFVRTHRGFTQGAYMVLPDHQSRHFHVIGSTLLELGNIIRTEVIKGLSLKRWKYAVNGPLI